MVMNMIHYAEYSVSESVFIQLQLKNSELTITILLYF